MYRITINNDGLETLIHAPYVNDLKLDSGQIKTEINKIDSFDFTILINNPGYGKIKPLKTLISVYNTKTNKFDFEGRVLGPGINMDSSGMVESSYVCEGELGYLHDSVQRHLEYTGNVVDLFTTIIDYHNSQVEDYKKFEVGNVTVTDPNDYVYLYLSAEDDTFDTIKTKLLDRLGGELQIRKENGVRYLDYLVNIGEHKSTEIRLSKNLVTSSVDIDSTEIVTRLTPLGNRIKSENPDAVDASEARLTIESVNGGLPYLDRPDLIALFGIQGKSMTWDDVSIASNLKSKGQEFLNNQKVSHNQYKISALDLFLIGLDNESFYVGNWHPVINPVMSLNEELRIIGKTSDINSPHDGNLTIGDKFKTRSEYQQESNKSSLMVAELQSRIEAQSSTILNLNNKIASANQTMADLNAALQIDDETGTAVALVNLQSSIDTLSEDIGNLPVYGLATHTSDGLMSSVDKQRLDNIDYGLASATEDGLMSSTDKVALDKTVVDTGDISLLTTTDKTTLVSAINELVTRITALEGTP